eukprot:2608760-Rhodomonas_salina.1
MCAAKPSSSDTPHPSPPAAPSTLRAPNTHTTPLSRTVCTHPGGLQPPRPALHFASCVSPQPARAPFSENATAAQTSSRPLLAIAASGHCGLVIVWGATTLVRELAVPSGIPTVLVGKVSTELSRCDARTCVCVRQTYDGRVCMCAERSRQQERGRQEEGNRMGNIEK